MGDKKFTSGEWLIQPTDGVFVYALNSSGANQFSLILSGNGNRGASAVELKANANLIKAAPDMYEEIEREVSSLECRLIDARNSGEVELIKSEIDRKVNLLAKARGEHK